MLHNLPPDRARRFELDRESVREVNPAAVWCCVSALGSDGPERRLTAFDLVAQALSGLLLANAHGAESPSPSAPAGSRWPTSPPGCWRRSPCSPGLVGRRPRAAAPGIEVSLLGAALAVQAQRFVSVEALDRRRRASQRTGGPRRPPTTSSGQARRPPRARRARALLPRLRAPPTASSCSPACTSASGGRRRDARASRIRGRPTRRRLPPTTPSARAGWSWWRSSSAGCAAEPAGDWIRRFRAAGVPASEVQPAGPAVRARPGRRQRARRTTRGARRRRRRCGCSARVFKVDGVATTPGGPIPRLGEHTEEVLSQCTSQSQRERAARRGARVRRQRRRTCGSPRADSGQGWTPGAPRPTRRRPTARRRAARARLDVGRDDPELVACAGLGAVELGRGGGAGAPTRPAARRGARGRRAAALPGARRVVPARLGGELVVAPVLRLSRLPSTAACRCAA